MRDQQNQSLKNKTHITKATIKQNWSQYRSQGNNKDYLFSIRTSSLEPVGNYLSQRQQQTKVN